MISLVALFIIFAAVIGTATLVGAFAYLLTRMRTLEGGQVPSAAGRELADQIERLEESLMAAQDEIQALTERLDFTEKLLMSGEESGPTDGPDKTVHSSDL